MQNSSSILPYATEIQEFLHFCFGLQGGPKKAPFFWYAITLPNINRFSKFFHCQSQEKISNNTVAKDPTIPQVCRYTTLWNVDVLKATIENKTTSSLSALTSSKINSEYYCRHVLGGGLLLDIRERCQRYSWTLQQDGTPSHTARNTLTYLRREDVTFIKPDVAPKQPGLESSRLRCLGCPSADGLSMSTIHDNLKQSIVTEWGKLSQHFSDRAIGQWRRRLECVVQQQGEHIEHLM